MRVFTVAPSVGDKSMALPQAEPAENAVPQHRDDDDTANNDHSGEPSFVHAHTNGVWRTTHRPDARHDSENVCQVRPIDSEPYVCWAIRLYHDMRKGTKQPCEPRIGQQPSLMGEARYIG